MKQKKSNQMVSVRDERVLEYIIHMVRMCESEMSNISVPNLSKYSTRFEQIR